MAPRGMNGPAIISRSVLGCRGRRIGVSILAAGIGELQAGTPVPVPATALAAPVSEAIALSQGAICRLTSVRISV